MTLRQILKHQHKLNEPAFWDAKYYHLFLENNRTHVQYFFKKPVQPLIQKLAEEQIQDL